MKILLSAFSCSPTCPSEPAVGWAWVEQISKTHQVWLLTSDEFEDEIRKHLPQSVTAIFVPKFSNSLRLKRIFSGLAWLYYYWWQIKLYWVAKNLHESIGFDIIHHVTLVSWRAPSFLSLLPVPFIWGPVGGGSIHPWTLIKELRPGARVLETFRSLCQFIPKIDPFVRMTINKATLIIVTDEEMKRYIPRQHQWKVKVMLGVGLHAVPTLENNAKSVKSDKFEVIFIGRLIGYKGGLLAVKAFHRLCMTVQNSHLTILGDGPDRSNMEQLAKNIGISHKISFKGYVSPELVRQQLIKSDVLLFPSSRDSGGFAVLEALAEECPVVCIDRAGPGSIVNGACGIKIPINSANQVINDMGNALIELAQRPEERIAKGESGRRHIIETFLWDKRGREMLKLYENARLNKIAR